MQALLLYELPVTQLCAISVVSLPGDLWMRQGSETGCVLCCAEARLAHVTRHNVRAWPRDNIASRQRGAED